jgi:hypothetical protein
MNTDNNDVEVNFTVKVPRGVRLEAGTVNGSIRATDLAGDEPLWPAVAAAVSRTLSRHGLAEPLPADFFAAPPEPRGRWLLLVDGIDEVIDVAARRAVLRKLSRMPGGRFVLGTRPLAEPVRDDLGPETEQYALDELSLQQIRDLAHGWLRSHGHDDPVAEVERFLGAARRSGVADLLRVPLMAVLLCRLWSAAPDKELPTARTAVYQSFVQQCLEQFHAGPGGVFPQARALVERYGPDAVAAAERTLSLLPTVLPELAYRQLTGEPLTHPGFARPEPVLDSVWAAFLADALRRTGLLVEHPPRFAHPTLVEYLAACHTAGDEGAHEAILRARLAAVQRRIRAARYLSVPAPAPEASYLGFLLDARPPSRHTADVLNRLATGREIQGREFLAQLFRLGVALPAEVVERATATLRRNLARRRSYSPGDRVRAAATLADFDPDEGEKHLAEVGTYLAGLSARFAPEREYSARHLFDLLSYSHEIARGYLALRLAERDDPRGAALLSSMAADTYLQPMTRAHCGGALADLHMPEARETLHGLAVDPTMGPTGRALAARLLGLKLRDRRATSLLIGICQDPDSPTAAVARAAFSLARVGDRRGITWLAQVAETGTLTAPQDGDNYLVRYSATTFLYRLGDQRAAKLYGALQREDGVPWYVRMRARWHRRRMATAAFQ